MATDWFRGLTPGRILIIGVGWFVISFGTCTAVLSANTGHGLEEFGRTIVVAGFVLGASGCVALPVAVVAAILVAIFRRAPAKDDLATKRPDYRSRR